MDVATWLTAGVSAPAAAVPIPRAPTPAAVLLLGSMLSVQLGGALSVGVFDEVGPSGTAWLRLSWAALIVLVLIRPRPRSITRAGWRAGIGLGVASGVMTLAYFGAIARLPLGTTSALEFLGPLGVAVATRASGRAGLVLPVVAALGVLCLTEPWTGAVDGLGVALALVAAGGWAAYIVLTDRVGQALPGLMGLAVSFPVAALCATPFGLADAAGDLTWTPVLQAAGLALLLPVLPYALELVAMRRLTQAAFGTLMCVEPGIGVVVGLAVLGQEPRALGVLGVALVVVAGIGAQRTGRR